MSNPTRRSPTIAWRIPVRESDLDTAAKAVAYTLSTYMNGRAVAFPSKETLAAGASVSKRAADRAVERLQLAGFLLVAKTKGRTSNRYAAALPTLSAPTG
jgi:Helix-turn-helix domain